MKKLYAIMKLRMLVKEEPDGMVGIIGVYKNKKSALKSSGNKYPVFQVREIKP